MSSVPRAVVEVTAADLLGRGVVACPNPRMAPWSSHPKVFIALPATGEGRCPYCGTVYRLKADARVSPSTS